MVVCRRFLVNSFDLANLHPVLQAILIAVVVLLVWFAFVLIYRGLVWFGTSIFDFNKNLNAHYGKRTDLLDGNLFELMGRIGRFNSGHFAVMPMVEAEKVLEPRHISHLKPWNILRMRQEIDFVIYHKQKMDKSGKPKLGMVPACGVMLRRDGNDAWCDWLNDAFKRAKVPFLLVEQQQLDDGEDMIEKVTQALISAPPVPDWTRDLIKISMAPKFPPETLKD